jgi:hypothetical protein
VGLSSWFAKGAAAHGLYTPGDAVPYSGIYRVTHHNRHAPEHDVTCVSGKAFPLCNECGAGVRFRLLHAVRLIDKHEWFSPSAAARSPRPAQAWWASAASNGDTEVL